MSTIDSILSRLTGRKREAAQVSAPAPPAVSAPAPDPDWAAVRERYREYPREMLGYATVRDYCDSADQIPHLLEFESDLKDAQRPWTVKAVLCRLDRGTSLIEIGGGVPKSSSALAALGYRPTIVDPYEGYANGPTEFDLFKRNYPEIGFVRELFSPALTEFQRESADCIFSVSTLEHIHDQTPIFEGIEKFLKPGGWSIHCVDISIRGTMEKFSTDLIRDVLRRQRQLAGMPPDDDEYTRLVQKMNDDVDTYFLGPQGLHRWRGGRAYDLFPYQPIASIQTCVQKRA
jgi:hypothetical protein